MSKRVCTYHQAKLEAFGINLKSILSAPELPMEIWVMIYNHVPRYIDKVHMKLVCKAFYSLLPMCYRPPAILSKSLLPPPASHITCWHMPCGNAAVPFACAKCSNRVRRVLKAYNMEDKQLIFRHGLPLPFYPFLKTETSGEDGFVIETRFLLQ